MIILNSNSWHANLYKFTYGYLNKDKNFCSYFWTVVFLSIFFPVIFVYKKVLLNLKNFLIKKNDLVLKKEYETLSIEEKIILFFYTTDRAAFDYKNRHEHTNLFIRKVLLKNRAYKLQKFNTQFNKEELEIAYSVLGQVVRCTEDKHDKFVLREAKIKRVFEKILEVCFIIAFVTGIINFAISLIVNTIITFCAFLCTCLLIMIYHTFAKAERQVNNNSFTNKMTTNKLSKICPDTKWND